MDADVKDAAKAVEANPEMARLNERQSELATLIRDMDAESQGQALDGPVREKWNELNGEYEANKTLLDELTARAVRLVEIGNGNGKGTAEVGVQPFNVHTDTRGDIYDLSTIRASVANPEGARKELNERARIAIERDAEFPTRGADDTKVREHLARLLQEKPGVAEQIMFTGSVTYRRAFAKAIRGSMLTPEENRVLAAAEERALAVGTGAASAGLVVPYTLDPTLIPTSNGIVNPIRSVARVEQITGLEWRSATSGGITANRRAEAVEMTDNAPTLAGVSRQVSRVDVWVPFSFEAGQDWTALESEIATAINDAKDEEEASFFTGNGTLPNPQGVITGTTNTVNASAGGAFTLANLYALFGALPPRYRPRARFMADLLVANMTRQFDTAGGAGLWTQLSNDTPATLLGKPFHEASAMSDVTTVGAKFFLYGDFSRYVIVDRIGMQIETVNHVVGTNHIPTGQRGILAFWRNNAFVADANGFRTLLGLA
jgi:HK97 family phage major capsid protein